ncbi:MAG: peptidase S10 [Acidobacteriaceae bacterium]|nr:peptidase S10 [Acidobacteriaceae bacterium]
MRKKAVTCVLALSGLILAGIPAVAQTPENESGGKSAEAKAGTEKPPKEESSVTEHSIQLNGHAINYKASAGTILLKNEQEEQTALLYYTGYTQTGLSDLSVRPLVFIYNGGPGGSSAPQHMGAFGPKRVVTVDAQPTPPSPYTLVDNTAGCLLDAADLVFIDPVGTGFSHAVGKAKDKDFWGIDEDVKSLAQFINTYVSRNDRWNSPKFLIGESYGTFRNAALANYLQENDGMDLNGIVMISTVLDLSTISFSPGDDLPYVLYLPSYAAVAWYHNVIPNRSADLGAFLAEARQFASGEYASALLKGSKLGASERAAVVTKLSHFTGLSEDYVSKADLRVNLAQFMAELQRSRGLITGRLDARFSGPAFDILGEYGSYDPMEPAVFGAFVASFNHYVRDDLKFGQGQTYRMLNEAAGRQWNWKRSQGHAGGYFPGSPNVEDDLVHAMVGNPHLKVQVENGYFDLATPFFGTEYTMEHLALPEKLRGNIKLEYYDAGHMMYLHEAALQKLKANIAGFIRSASEEAREKSAE